MIEKSKQLLERLIIQSLINSKNRYDRVSAVDRINSNFRFFSNKEKAWQNLHTLTHDEYHDVRYVVADTIGSVFTYIPDKKSALKDLQRLIKDKHEGVRRGAANAISTIFPCIPDKEQAWQDLHALVNDEDKYVRSSIAEAIGTVIRHILNKNQAWQDLQLLIQDDDRFVRISAIKSIGVAFSSIPDKQKAWQGLIHLTMDNERSVSYYAINSLGIAFPYTSNKKEACEDLYILIKGHNKDIANLLISALPFIPDKELAWLYLTRLIKSNLIDVWQIKRLLKSIFPRISDKNQAWEFLHQLTLEKDKNIRAVAAMAIGTVFHYIPRKEQAWEDLHKLSFDDDYKIIINVVEGITIVISEIPDKKQTYNDLNRLFWRSIKDKRELLTIRIAESLRDSFLYIIDKRQASENIQRLIHNENEFVRAAAAVILSNSYSYIPVEEQAWGDLHRLLNDDESIVRSYALSALGDAFPYIVDQKQACEDLNLLVCNEKNSDESIRWKATVTLGDVFSLIPNKKNAWRVLHGLTQDENYLVRKHAVDSIGNAFSYIPNKKQAWKDMIRLVEDESTRTRENAINSIFEVFINLPDEKQVNAWKEINHLMNNKDSDIRRTMVYSIGVVFKSIPQKQVFYYLHQLILDSDDGVRWAVAKSLGSAFSYIPQKEQALEDLILLTRDKDSEVRSTSYHSIGKIYVLKACEACNREEIQKYLDSAIENFDNSIIEEPRYSSSFFCSPFYKSFSTVLFEPKKAKNKNRTFIEEAKQASEGSEIKDKLLDIVTFLEKALDEAQNAQDFKEKKDCFDACRQYCEHAADLLDAIEDEAPGAAKLVRKGLPIIDERIKQILYEIQENAISLCKQTKRTPLEKLGGKTYIQSNNLLVVRDQVGLEKGVRNLQNTILDICSEIPKKAGFDACRLQKRIIEEQLIEDKLPLISEFMREISYQMFSYKIQIGCVNMGNIFKNNQNLTIINESIVENSFNKIIKEYDEEVAFALLQIAEFIEKSKNKPAGILFDQFNKEVHETHPDKSTLKEIWEGIENTLPSIATISEVVAKLSPLFKS